MNETKRKFPIPFQLVLTGVSDATRWRLLVELMKEDALTSSELARRVGIPKSNASKHMLQLLRCQLVTRGYGNVYRIPAEYKVPGENTLDFGAAVVRLDAVNAR